MTTNEGDYKSPIVVVHGGPTLGPIKVGPGGLTVTAGGLSTATLRNRVANLKVPDPDIEISEGESHHLADLYNELFDYEEVFAYLSSEAVEGTVALVDLPVPTQVVEFLHGHDDLVNRLESKIGVPSSQKTMAVEVTDRVSELYQQIFDLLEGLAEPLTSS